MKFRVIFVFLTAAVVAYCQAEDSDGIDDLMESLQPEDETDAEIRFKSRSEQLSNLSTKSAYARSSDADSLEKLLEGIEAEIDEVIHNHKSTHVLESFDLKYLKQRIRNEEFVDLLEDIEAEIQQLIRNQKLLKIS